MKFLKIFYPVLIATNLHFSLEITFFSFLFFRGGDNVQISSLYRLTSHNKRIASTHVFDSGIAVVRDDVIEKVDKYLSLTYILWMVLKK